MKQLFFLAFAFLVSVSGPVRAEEPLFSGPAQEAALKNKAKQTFGGTDFFFARGSQKTNEYLPAGETLQDWKQMLAVYIFPGFPSAEQYVTAMVYKMGEHKIPVQAFKAKKDGEFIVIFPMVAKDVTDCALLLEAIASYDKKDSTSVKRESYDFTSALKDDVKGLRIGIPRDYFGEGLDPEVAAAVKVAAKVLEEKGAVVEEFDLSLVDYAIPAYYVIASAEASSNLARFDGVKYGYRTEEYEGLHNMYKKTRSEGFGPEVKRRIMLGSFVLSSGYYDAYYLKALRTKALIRQAFDRAFEKYDVILGPAAPTTAPKLGESLSDPLQMYLGDVYTISANLAGLPGICLPCGMDSKGLPIGLQLLGDCFKEEHIIRAAYAYECSRGRTALAGKRD